MMILSGDPPRSRSLSILLIVIVAALAVAPFVFPGAKAMNVATKICIFAALVASYDLLLGYTGSVSFGHTMVYRIGSFAVWVALASLGPRLVRACDRAVFDGAELGRGRHGACDRAAAGGAAGVVHRLVLAAGGGDF